MRYDPTYLLRRIKKGVRNLPSLAMGFNIYVDRDKLRLIDHAFNLINPSANSFADLGGIWKVNAAYTFYILKRFHIDRAFLVDTSFTPRVNKRASRYSQLTSIRENFGTASVQRTISHVDIVLMFDVLLHQVRPNWDEILKAYSDVADCFVIFNQQYVESEKTFRLTDLSLEAYKAIVPTRREKLYDFIFSHKSEENSTHKRAWIDIPDIFQWAITDDALRTVMQKLNFQEVYYRNCGPFSSSRQFENHAFIFVKDSL